MKVEPKRTFGTMCLILLLSLISGCHNHSQKQKDDKDRFDERIKIILQKATVPGASIQVRQKDQVVSEIHHGWADYHKQLPVNESTQFPIASITKVFSAVLVNRLAEQKKLSLEDPISKYVSHASIGDDILIKHVLSHTSERQPGLHFNYSARFSWLTQVIEKASGKSFADYMKQELIVPMNLTETGFLLSDDTFNNPSLAQPYNYGQPPEPGNKESGYSASAGLFSTPNDLGSFFNALMSDQLISLESRQSMTTAFHPHSPYGMGLFSAQVWGQPVIWVYGQYDSYSSLFIHCPEQELSFTVLMNNNVLNDFARLINGEITYSLLALLFFEAFVFEDLPQGFLLQQKLSEAQLNAYLSRFDLAYLDEAKTQYRSIINENPVIENWAHLNVLHALIFLKDVHYYMELGPFNEFDVHIEKMASYLDQKDQNNPYLNAFMAAYHIRNNEKALSKKRYKRILSLENMSPNWYIKEAENFLKNHD